VRRVFVVMVLAIVVAAVTAGAGADGVVQGVRAEKYNYKLGDKIVFEYAIHNEGSETVVYSFPTAKQFDVWVSRGGEEVFRESRGRMYAQIITTLALKPGETKSYCATWDQKDFKGKQVGPGVYDVHAQLTPSRNRPSPTVSKVQLGAKGAALIPITIKEAISNYARLVGKRVLISAIYRGWSPNPGDPNTKDGPPISKSDWAICDGSGCMYVVGSVDLDPAKDTGARITVIGKLEKNSKGQVYLMLESATVPPKACRAK
jgi:hypothetical protein